jgi:hypothetical protein
MQLQAFAWMFCFTLLRYAYPSLDHTVPEPRIVKYVRVGRQLTVVGTTGSFESAWWRGRFRPLGPRTGQPDVWGPLALAVEAWCKMKMRENKLDY